jgi:hypothetical protein
MPPCSRVVAWVSFEQLLNNLMKGNDFAGYMFVLLVTDLSGSKCHQFATLICSLMIALNSG